MAYQNQNFYTEGSAARQMNPAPRDVRPTRRPRPRRRRVLVIHVDFLALTGMLLAAALLLTMVVEFGNLVVKGYRLEQAQAYVQELELNRNRLERIYRTGYDPEQIRQEALEHGMIPISDAQVVTIPNFAGEK